MATTNDRAKAIALVEKLRALDEDYAGKRDAVLAELSAILGGGEGIGLKLARLKETYSELWAIRYKAGPYQFNHASDTAQLKRFLVAHDEAEVTARICRYLRSEDAFYVRARHPFTIFVKNFNQFVEMPDPRGGTLEHAATSEKMRGLRGE